jgi:tRNA dimethylallyltransferase
MEKSKTSFVIFVLGTTGVGKSKLAIDIALNVGGEIINADSMQIYSGNGEGIMTARPGKEDTALVKHHLYEIAAKEEIEFSVRKYRAKALQAIADVHERGKVPIVCGGTNYYIESLLF